MAVDKWYVWISKWRDRLEPRAFVLKGREHVAVPHPPRRSTRVLPAISTRAYNWLSACISHAPYHHGRGSIDRKRKPLGNTRVFPIPKQVSDKWNLDSVCKARLSWNFQKDHETDV